MWGMNPLSVTLSVGTTVTNVDTQGRNVSNLTLGNPNSTVAYVQLFLNKAANVTLGTTTPDFAVLVPASTTVSVPIPGGLYSGNEGFSVAGTTTYNGSTAPTSDLLVAAIFG